MYSFEFEMEHLVACVFVNKIFVCGLQCHFLRNIKIRELNFVLWQSMKLTYKTLSRIMQNRIIENIV